MTTEVVYKPNSKSTDEFKIIVNSDEVRIPFFTMCNGTHPPRVVHEVERMESRR